ncbi:hypothetical protein [Natrinema salinisoli]|uniref:hypothetical protein n=1 Tax=Natrinema salinisoli TaxID=2878535 RepID=UPI001CF00FE8|nr:hypothetical protein [Natrinema salinisoli]
MYEAIELARTYPTLAMVAVLAVILAYAKAKDTVYGQPRDGGNFDKYRTTRVKETYRYASYTIALGVLVWLFQSSQFLS